MELSIGKLPEHHPFLLIVRPLTDWVFKFIGWLVIGATLVFAWEKTHSPYLGGLALLATVLPGTFLYSFLQWLGKLERKPKTGVRRIAGRWRRVRTAVAVILSGIVWSGLTIATQVAVQQTASAILEFQKTPK